MSKQVATFGVIVGLWLGACSSGNAAPPATTNAMFERWCDDHPCGWQLTGGRRVGTWHPNDYAAELVDDDAEISQVSAQFTQAQATCLNFSLIAKIDDETRVLLELDFLNDGTVEFSQRIPPSNWEVRTFTITTPTWYRGVRFSIRKDGPGRAIVGELFAGAATFGCSPTSLSLSNRPPGAKCETDDQCASAICMDTTCVDCASDQECDANQICGAAAVSGPAPTSGSAATALVPLWTRTCVAPASAVLGEYCNDDAQCQGSICVDGVCSECESERDCPNEQRCAIPSDVRPSVRPSWPKQCAPKQRLRKGGSACVSPSDCASGVCMGGSAVCYDASCNGASSNGSSCITSCDAWHVSSGTCD